MRGEEEVGGGWLRALVKSGLIKLTDVRDSPGEHAG